MLKKNSVLKNASWIIVCKIVQSMMNLIISMISARYLGPSNYGIISYAASIVAFVVPIVQLGLRNTLVQEIVAEPDKSGETLGTALMMSVIASILGVIGVISFVSIVNRNEVDTIIVCALYSVSLFFQMLEMIQYWFQAQLLSKYTSLTSLVAYIIVSLYKIYILFTGKNIYWFAVTNSLDYLLIAIILIVVYKKISKQKFSFSIRRAKLLFAHSKYYIVSGMMVTIFANTDRIMIKLMVNDVASGYYSAAANCAGVTSFVFYAIIDSFRPIIFDSKKNNQRIFEEKLTMLYSIVIYMGLMQSLVLCIGAKVVIEILYGNSYADAAQILRIITWYSSFSYMGSVRNIWILAEKQQSVLWIINLSGALLNVIGNFILIPLYGARGAAIASVATQFFTNFVLCFVITPIYPVSKLILSAFDFRNIKLFFDREK